MKVYLAGPEVFLPEAVTIGEWKRAICSRHGLLGIYPLDDEVSSTDPERRSQRIFEGLIATMRDCDAIIANLTPFRSVSADPGTAFELGFMMAAGKRLFGYTNIPGTILDRTRAREEVRLRDGRPFGEDGVAVEDFGLFDNLMLAEALSASGFGVVAAEAPLADPARDLGVFERCVALAASRLP